jgi:hypothetical protein
MVHLACSELLKEVRNNFERKMRGKMTLTILPDESKKNVEM